MIRFYNGRVLSFTGGLTVSENELWTDGEKISYIGPKPDVLPEFERSIDLKGDLLIPGFKDAHTHTPMTFLRSFAEDLPLQRWLEEKCWPNEAKLTDESAYDMTKLGILEYLSSGITAAFDMYSHSDAYARANIDSGFRTVICSAMNDFDKDPHDIERDYLHVNSMSSLVSYKLGIHAEYTTGMERLKYMADLCEKYHEPFYTHISETRSEVEGCRERYGMTPPQLFDRLGMFRYGGGGFHCVWLTDEDIDLFVRKGLWVITNPSSNLKLASGIAPIQKMMNAGVNLAIGTDSAASNNALDMFREMYLVTALQKYYCNDAAACSAEAVLEMACRGGALAMGLEDCSDLQPGMKADLAVINLRRPNMQPLNRIAANIVLSGSKENVRLTMVNGRILYEDGEFYIGESADEIYRRAEKFMIGIRQ